MKGKGKGASWRAHARTRGLSSFEEDLQTLLETAAMASRTKLMALLEQGAKRKKERWHVHYVVRDQLEKLRHAFVARHDPAGSPYLQNAVDVQNKMQSDIHIREPERKEGSTSTDAQREK